MVGAVGVAATQSPVQARLDDTPSDPHSAGRAVRSTCLGRELLSAFFHEIVCFVF